MPTNAWHRAERVSAEQDKAPFHSYSAGLPRLQQLLHEDLMGNGIKSLHTYMYIFIYVHEREKRGFLTLIFYESSQEQNVFMNVHEE